ncbi:anti-sigma factor domain-containing protein [Geodermatophilus sp. SYSU D01180]
MSPRPDSHEPFDELAVGWALHALEPEDEALFGAHLPTCPRCTRTVAETSEVMAALAADLPQAEPDDRLRERLRAAVEETEQLPPPAGVDPAAPAAAPVPPPVPDTPGGRRRTDRPVATGFPGYVPTAGEPALDPRPVWRRVLPNALVAAAVAAILALGTWNVVLSSARDDARTAAAEQQQVLEALLQPGRATIAPVQDGDGDPVATVVARDAQLEVVAHGLRVNDSSDSVYVVWGVADDAPVALGTFDVVSPQTDLRTVGSASTGLDDYAAYAISIEPGRQAPAGPSDVVANGQVTS